MSRQPGPLLSRLPDAVVVYDLDGRPRWASPAFERLLGFGQDEVADLTVNDLVHPDDLARISRTAREALNGEGVARSVYRIRRRDWVYRWVESLARPIPAGDQFAPGIVAVIRDIEPHQAVRLVLEDEQAVSAHLRRIAEEQHEAITAIAHRARSPMTAVLGFAQTLRERYDELSSDQQRELLNRLVISVERLVGVIDDATDLDRFVTGERHVQRRPVDVREIIHRAVDAVSEPALAPIQVDAPPALVVHLDAPRVGHALRLLLRAALAHTPLAGQIRVRAGRDDHVTTIVVEHPGAHLSSEIRGELFGAFSAVGGAGMPEPFGRLALGRVAHIAADHGGRAWATDGDEGRIAYHLRLR